MIEREAVAFLGPLASYTHQATLDSFDECKYTLQPVVNIEDVFSAVQSGDARFGVVPVENSTNGAVVFTLDLLADLDDRYPAVLICSEAYVRIQHCLLSRTSDLGHITRLYSHPQAWGQCKRFLDAHLRGVERLDCSSTSRAAAEAAHDVNGTSGAISSAMAAKTNGLNVLVEGINDCNNNTTRFFVLRRRAPSEDEGEEEQQSRPADQGDGEEEEMERWKSLVGFTVDHDHPGALADCLAVFKRYRLNLTSINTRPSGVGMWNYIFFVEFHGRRLPGHGGAANAALRDLGRVARSWRWLGSWQNKSGT